MKKNFIMFVALVLILTHVIPPYKNVLANDEVNECENMNFTVQTIIENDKKIVGTSLPLDQINIEFKTKNKTEVINVSGSGDFELTVEEEFLETNDVITISNEHFKVDTKVASEGTAPQSIQSSQYVECPVIVEEEISEPEETPEEATSEEEVSESEGIPEEAASEEEVSESEETPEEATSEEEVSESEETSEKAAGEQEVSESEETSEKAASEEEVSESEETSEEAAGEEGVSESEETSEETSAADVNDELSDKELAQIDDVVSKSRDRSELIIKEFELLIDDIAKNETNTVVPFSSLAEVQLLTDVSIEAGLNEPVDGEKYTLNLNLDGTGAADVELTSPDRVVVFYTPDLSEELTHNGRTASVRVDILPLTMEDLPLLNTALEGLQGTLTGLLTGLISGINDALPLIISPHLVEVNGLDELNGAIDNLNNLNNALADVLSYTDDVTYTVNEDGIIVVDFSDGLGNHLETVVTDIVQAALDDVTATVNSLEISILSGLPIVGGLLSSLTNDLLLPLIGNVTSVVTDLSTDLTNGTIDLTNNLASAQIIGNTNVNLDVLVNNPPGDVSGEIPVFGAGIQDSVIDIALLDSLQSQTTVTIPDPPRFILTQPENIIFNTTEINSGEELIYRQDNEYNIEVTDERPNSNWTLSIQALEPLKTVDEIHSLPDSLFYFEDGNEPKSIENEPVEIAQKDQNDTSDIQNIVWDKEEGLLLKTDPINAVAGQEYSTTIEWTLTDGP